MRIKDERDILHGMQLNPIILSWKTDLHVLIHKVS